MKILLCDNGVPFDLKTPYNESLGGSETTLLLLAKGLSELSHQIVLLTNINYKDQERNIILDNINLFDQYAEMSDVIILNRFIPKTIMEYTNKKKIFYISHDAYDQNNIKWMMNFQAESHLNKIICVSDWQKETFIKYLHVDPNKLITLGNPIDYSLYYGSTERDSNKLIYASIPFKGLELLSDLFNEIKFKSKNEKLNLDIYSSFKMYNREEENQKYNDVYSKLNNTENINIYNSISMRNLAFKFKQSSFYIAPSTYHETFGRVFVEAMASGCLPITLNNGANKEIIEDNGFVLDYSNIHNSEAFEKYTDLVCDLLEQNLYNKRINAERNMKKWDYIKLSKKLENIILKY